jgi:AraC-like DNA-binding protein
MRRAWGLNKCAAWLLMPRMEYREHAVPAELRRHLASVWRLVDASPAGEAQTIYPDGCCELIVHLATPPRGWDAHRGWHDQAATLFAAQHLGPVRLLASSPIDCVGLRLQPEASAILGGRSLVRDRILDLAGVDAPFSRALRRAARAFANGETGVLWALVKRRLASQRALVKRRLASQPIDGAIAGAVAQLRGSTGATRIETVARTAGLSLRTLQTRFRRQVGLTPKEFARDMRLRATLQAMDAGDSALVDLAADQGFADQAHATREVRRITGLAPARLRAALRKDRAGEAAVRLAAAFVRGHS